jgi:hypothetical protein
MKKQFLQLLLTLCLASTTLFAAPLVAVLGSPSDPGWNSDVKAKLDATGLLGGVDLFDVIVSGPTLAQLSIYDAVLVYSDNPIPASVGDTLADYVDGGGRVVDGVFSNFAVYGIGGRWASGGYSLLTLVDDGVGNATLGTHDSSHPIMNGVTNFDGGDSSFRAQGTVTPGAAIIASWSDGTPLVITGTISGQRRVTLNFYPPSSDARADFWNSTSDGGLLMANALLYASEGTESIPEPSTYALIGAGLVLIVRLRR